MSIFLPANDNNNNKSQPERKERLRQPEDIKNGTLTVTWLTSQLQTHEELGREFSSLYLSSKGLLFRTSSIGTVCVSNIRQTDIWQLVSSLTLLNSWVLHSNSQRIGNLFWREAPTVRSSLPLVQSLSKKNLHSQVSLFLILFVLWFWN